MLVLAASNSPERLTKGGKNTFYVTHYYGSPMQVENCDSPCMHVCPRHYPPLISCVKSHILTQSPVAASTQKRDEYFLIFPSILWKRASSSLHFEYNSILKSNLSSEISNCFLILFSVLQQKFFCIFSLWRRSTKFFL